MAQLQRVVQTSRAEFPMAAKNLAFFPPFPSSSSWLGSCCSLVIIRGVGAFLYLSTSEYFGMIYSPTAPRNCFAHCSSHLLLIHKKSFLCFCVFFEVQVSLYPSLYRLANFEDIINCFIIIDI